MHIRPSIRCECLAPLRGPRLPHVLEPGQDAERVHGPGVPPARSRKRVSQPHNVSTVLCDVPRRRRAADDTGARPGRQDVYRIWREGALNMWLQDCANSKLYRPDIRARHILCAGLRTRELHYERKER